MKLIPQKRCTKCAEFRLITQFHRNKNRRDGRANWCGNCARKKANRLRLVDKLKPGWQKLRREQCRKSRYKLREEFIAAYGRKCVCCGEKRFHFLTLEHKRGGGRAHALALGGHHAIFSMLRRAGWPKKNYELLCSNCNHSKGCYGY
jgi:hypothetical protein